VPRPKPASVAYWVSFLISTGGAAVAADAPATSPAPGDQPPQQLEEVVVTGLRKSFESSLEDKKNSFVVQDSINAEELGRFPDADVADSLQHITGITRSIQIRSGRSACAAKSMIHACTAIAPAFVSSICTRCGTPRPGVASQARAAVSPQTFRA